MTPTADQINPHKDLDGDVAEAHFLGKSLADAEAMFEVGVDLYYEDLIWMGPQAFCFYFPAYTSYLRSDAALGHSDAINYLAGMLKHWLSDRESDISAVHGDILAIVEYVAANYSRFDVDYEIYGDLKARLQAIAERVADSPT